VFEAGLQSLTRKLGIRIEHHIGRGLARHDEQSHCCFVGAPAVLLAVAVG
jgi:hypothetical protein